MYMYMYYVYIMYMYMYYVYILCIMKENNESLEIISNGKNNFVWQGFTYSAKWLFSQTGIEYCSNQAGDLRYSTVGG